MKETQPLHTTNSSSPKGEQTPTFSSVELILSQSQQKVEEELKELVTIGTALLSKKPSPHEMPDHLQNLSNFLASTPRMMEISSAIYSIAKGVAANEALNNKSLLAAKQDVQRRWLEGKVAKYEALYQKCETIKKAIDKSIDSYRTLISYEKEQIKAHI